MDYSTGCCITGEQHSCDTCAPPALVCSCGICICCAIILELLKVEGTLQIAHALTLTPLLAVLQVSSA